MTKSDFLQYNKSRSTTYENMIKKYGNELGDLKWRKYCERQAHTNSKEYLGDHEYSRINELKSHTYETYLKRYGNSEIAKEKIYEYHNKIIAPYSKKSQILFEMIKNDELFKNKKCYYATLNAEYGILDISTNRYFKYDFVCLDYMFGIEFQGDHYHGNPSVYSPTDFLKGRGQKHKIAKDVWEKDQYKCDLAKKERNIDVIQIWECDWDRDPKKILNRILEYVKDRV
jgi:hypothetical protein